MSADILEFRRKEGPLTEDQAAHASLQRVAADVLGRRIPDDLAKRLVDRLIELRREREGRTGPGLARYENVSA